MLVANDHDEPYEEESHPCQLCHLKSPGYVRYIVQDNIRQWGIPDDQLIMIGHIKLDLVITWPYQEHDREQRS